jgi:hypothetical protein
MPRFREVSSIGGSNPQVCRYRQFEKIAAQNLRREKQHLEVFYFPRIGVEARDHLVAEFLRFLLVG